MTPVAARVVAGAAVCARGLFAADDRGLQDPQPDMTGPPASWFHALLIFASYDRAAFTETREVLVMRRRHLVVGASTLALAVGAGGGAIAFAGAGDDQGASDDQTLTGSPAEKARAAALHYTRGGHAGIVEPESSDPDEHGATFGVEVTKPDGSKVDVFLDEGYKLLRIASNEGG